MGAGRDAVVNDIAIESDGGSVVSTEQWDSQLFLTIADGVGIEYEAKNILLNLAQVRRLAEWLAVWVVRHEEEK